MIAESGLIFLWLAAMMALLQGLFGLSVLNNRLDDFFSGAVKITALIQAALALSAFAMLLWLFMRVDLSVTLVAENDHWAKPMLYRVAASWGNHEGSMLLWVTILSFCGALLALFGGKIDQKLLSLALGSQAFLALGFFAFLLFVSNPFARLNPPATEGLGLNPLLQDPGLAFHPPTLYLGYVGLSVAFSFAVAALLTGKADRAFAKAMRIWVLGAWVFLTIGITAGSYWAYYELGWGGFWFWDPVENAALMPWLAATALFHSVSVLAKRDSLRVWTLVLAVTAFSMSMIGTFLVRSGILVSVHAFAVDPWRGSFILGLLGLYIGGALALFALRIAKIHQGNHFILPSREAGLVLNNLFLGVILAIVLIGTLYPLLAEMMNGEKLSVGAPYFNMIITPLALLLCLLMPFGTLLRWKQDRWASLKWPLLVGAGLFILTEVILALKGLFSTAPLASISLGVAVMVGLLCLWPLLRQKTIHLNLWGMVLAHLGIAITLGGIASDTLFSQELLTALKPQQTARLGDWQLHFDRVMPDLGSDWTAIVADIRLERNGQSFTLHPALRHFTNPVTDTSETALKTTKAGQLYLVLGQQAEDGRWQIRAWWKPLVTLIWDGGFLTAFGGILILLDRLLRYLQKRRYQNRPDERQRLSL
ncbi:heme lyase CcmF/NrfE family subunit [Zymomonas mobilis]|uniref:heme lyase CcmF/NrfE family subunit n=1 Tax=Zymomonas mobilis TaxID=542 RepID=UPI0003C74905|nr:heme lyase CcmF/NrfE family subunit [Zymomonas mobilis]AHB09420.1 c-type cytochrome biogenesis protein CcmF [Zymomonas mobilis subsp. mobilis str. CP4 = NRRL B-14023]AHJ69726.1 Cytochrome c-type biogenesis protein CcmF [Zymomonas mobilis subsp. mobilis NRRL B-12526]AHJ71582.1 Cytochrome c-type biogenesis protein CcmF [Zymomonas mobilis subsp. mobilis str. CP4 = NRRL B-14023]TWE24285.1 cytochrome c-type biogenesis protein CcmF [Zymomonas mobilis]